ncbi:ATPase AAA [Haloarcula mannanilytica]|uniref:ATPase AAA n=1 Tax=Haloarcula mannanilytica TaxID=2509225 RepID=A0A4C2ELX1_9EURY|nr:ATP-binding protein [Haloarcula mannanilytica]GCF15385.1 ATPase AAA [Haloarcula mannanilytica]
MEPYPDNRAHLTDELRRIDSLLYHYLETWRAESAANGDVPGLYVSDAEVEQILTGDRTATQSTTDTRDRHADWRETIDDRVTATAATDTTLRLQTLAERFGLSDRHIDALLLAVAPDLDLEYEKVFAYLQDDLTRKRPTVDLVARILGSTDRGPLDERYRLSESSPLVSTGLVRPRLPETGAPLLAASVTADRRVVAYLLGRDDVDPAIADCTEAIEADTTIRDLPLDDEVRRKVEGAEPATDQTQTMVTLSGPDGVGKRAAVAAMAAGLDRPLVQSDASRLLRSDCVDPITRVCREASLRNAVVHLTNVHRLDGENGQDGGIESVVTALASYPDHVFLSGTEDWQAPRSVDSHAVTRLRLPRPGYERRKELWDRRIADGTIDLDADDLDTADLAATFSLTRGRINEAIEQARRQSAGGLTSEGIYKACRAQSRETLGDLAVRSEPTYTWDDIVLPADELRQLHAVAAHLSHRGTVYSDWGFEDRFNLGTGLNVLFSGPSGTGKTMASEILANEAGLDLFKIDLASVVSKYIGETEKHLKRIFDEAEHSDALLFFDEADALFGERSEVSDSHDRYANVEVSYLLQRMEEHDGAVIMTTNLEENIDDAFQRRINRTVEFPRPDQASRYAIWQAIFPENTPVGELDYEFLSSFDLTGGNVENVALTAAFLAADDGGAEGEGRVEMKHVVRALRRELQKTGRLISADEFGEYAGLLP